MKSINFLKGLYGAAALAGAMALMQAPAAAQRVGGLHLVPKAKTDTAAQHKTIRRPRSVPPRKRSRCYG